MFSMSAFTPQKCTRAVSKLLFINGYKKIKYNRYHNSDLWDQGRDGSYWVRFTGIIVLAPLSWKQLKGTKLCFLIQNPKVFVVPVSWSNHALKSIILHIPSSIYLKKQSSTFFTSKGAYNKKASLEIMFANRACRPMQSLYVSQLHTVRTLTKWNVILQLVSQAGQHVPTLSGYSPVGLQALRIKILSENPFLLLYKALLCAGLSCFTFPFLLLLKGFHFPLLSRRRLIFVIIIWFRGLFIRR